MLLSGGVDSAACVHFYREINRPTYCVFVDYGQLAVVDEWRAARAVASHYSVPIAKCSWRGIGKYGIGIISGRNAFLLVADIDAATIVGHFDSNWHSRRNRISGLLRGILVKNPGTILIFTKTDESMLQPRG